MADAELVVNRSRRTEEKGRRACAGERCRQLAPDDAGLAHATDDYAAATAGQQFNSTIEIAIELGDQAEDRLRFGFEHTPCQLERLAARAIVGERDGHYVATAAELLTMVLIRTSRSRS